MKVANLDERIHVLNSTSTLMTVVKDIANSGLQEEAFYVLDIGDIVQKHRLWKQKLPRVDPFYGKLNSQCQMLSAPKLFTTNHLTYVVFLFLAVKCNDSLTVLEVLASLGVGFDCASKVTI